MNSTTQTESLLKIIQNYKKEDEQTTDTIREFLHFHEKNPDAKTQIMLLEDIRKYINSNLTGKEQKMAELGALLILRALLSDTNSQGQVFIYLIEKLDLEKEIEEVLQQIEPKETIDPTDEQYVNISEEAIKTCKAIIESPDIISKYSANFVKDLIGTINTELDYDNRMLLTLKPPSR